MDNDILSPDRRQKLNAFLQDITCIEQDLFGQYNRDTDPLSYNLHICSRLSEIIDQAKVLIADTKGISAKDRSIEALQSARKNIESCQTNALFSIYDLIDISNHVYISIHAFLTLSYEHFQRRTDQQTEKE